jgi:hypothetical protein
VLIVQPAVEVRYLVVTLIAMHPIGPTNNVLKQPLIFHHFRMSL